MRAESLVLRWLARAVVALAVLINAIFGGLSLFAPASFLAIVGHPGEAVTSGTEIFAAYTGARDLAVAISLVVLVAMRSTRVLPGLLLVVALANALDGIDAIASGRGAQVPGALVAAILFSGAGAWLFGRLQARENL